MTDCEFKKKREIWSLQLPIEDLVEDNVTLRLFVFSEIPGNSQTFGMHALQVVGNFIRIYRERT